MGGKIISSSLSSQIPMMLYQKALTGVFVGAVFQRLITGVFVGAVFQRMFHWPLLANVDN